MGISWLRRYLSSVTVLKKVVEVKPTMLAAEDNSNSCVFLESALRADAAVVSTLFCRRQAATT